MSMKYEKLISLVNEILEQYEEATIRQIYYRLVSPPYQYMANTRSMYTSYDSQITRAREEGLVDWRKIVDRTRTVLRAGSTWDSPNTFVADLIESLKGYHKSYAIDLWANQENLLSILVEKDALAHIISSEAVGYQVDVVPGRGYNSFTQLKNQAIELTNKADIDKSIIILYFGDFDPSGLDIDRSAEGRIRQYSGLDFEFIRVALTEKDIVNLPPNPIKLNDKRAKAYILQYGNACWELDALPPDQLRVKVREAIEGYINRDKWNHDMTILNAGQLEVQSEIKGILEHGKGI